MPEFMSEEERHEAGLIPRELAVRLGEAAVKDFQFSELTDSE
jgi:hypothetical protein